MRRIAYLGVGPGAEAGWTFLTSLPDASARPLALDESPAALGEADVVWVHATVEPPPLPREPLVAWTARGGRLLLTQRAASRVASLGLEDDGPNAYGTFAWHHVDDEFWFEEFRSFGGFPHIRGLSAFGPHPLFAGIDQGTYTWAPRDGEPYPRATYARGRRPVRGKVVACERSYIHLNEDRIVAWEYEVGRGGALCIGAFVALDAADRLLERQLHAVLKNALLGDGIPHATRAGPVTYWPAPGRTARRDPALGFPDRPPLDGALPGLDSPLHLSTRALADDPFTLAGRRALVVGDEQGGVREIWLHPHRVLRQLAVAVGGETPLVRDAQITPALIQRHLVSKYRIVEETVTVALEHPVVLLEYRAEKGGRARNVRAAAQLALGWRIDLRRMWPYPPAAGGDLRFEIDASGAGIIVTNAAESAWVAVQASRPVEWDVQPPERGAWLGVRLETALDEPLRLAVMGGVSWADLEAAAAALARRGVTGFTRQRARHEEQLRDYLVSLRSPDLRLNTAFEWAKVRLDGCFVETPGVGRSLAAGYAASRPGWGDGRPGYAWYVGRDSCWSAFALLAAGDFAGARLVLRFLGDTQDVSGKVIHEYTTSGLAHYDAADSTPLYLLLAGRYLAWTGDLAFLEQQWPRIERAYQFCLETDTDGDGVIENTRVGHGWIEMGPLAGAHVTLYLAGVWIAALEALAPLGKALGHSIAAELEERALRARLQVAKRFRLADGYAFGIFADGEPQRHRTALTAVPLLLGAVDPVPATAWLDAIASSEYSTPWGVRLLSNRDPLYNATGYHAGAVWPLYTGWVSLAEYACHRGEQAFEHLAANGRLPFAREQGAFDEVLHGDTEQAAGVCPDQAWSAAMLLLPAVEGLLGARPDALRDDLTLAPHLPARWRECEWRGLRVGHTSLDARLVRRDERLVLKLRRTSGRRLGLTLAPALPPGRVPSDATVDGDLLTPRVIEHLGCRHAEVRLELSGEHDVEIWHRPE